MRARLACFVVAVVAGLQWPAAPAADAAATLELYGTLHAMGVVVTVDAGDDPGLDH